MNLLLILSALLSALSGVSGGMRSVETPRIARSVADVAAAAAAVRDVRLTQRPSAGPAPLIEIVRPSANVRFEIAAIEPIFASRRRE